MSIILPFSFWFVDRYWTGYYRYWILQNVCVEDETDRTASWLRSTCIISYVHDENFKVHRCSSNGKYLTLMSHELWNMAIESNFTTPFDDTITFVLMVDLYEETSALQGKSTAVNAITQSRSSVHIGDVSVWGIFRGLDGDA